MFVRIFEIVSPIVLVVLVGYFYTRIRKHSMTVVNTINLDVFVPILTFSVFASQPINLGQYAPLILATALLTLLPGFVALAFYRPFNLDIKTLAPPFMFKNSGNIGIPLLILTFGEEFLPAILIMFIVENLLNFSVGIWILSPKERSFAFLKQPIVVATILGVSLSMLPVQLPSSMVTGLNMLGDIAVPLMLFALGVRLISLDYRGWRLGLFVSIAIPAAGLFVAAIVLPFIPLEDEFKKMAWIFAALPPAVLNYLLAEKYNQEPDKVAAIVLFSNMGSVIIIPIALYFIL